MSILTVTDARTLMGRGKAWTFRLELRDPASNSHKFWLCTGRSRHEPVEVHYGRVGSKPQIIVKDWVYVEQKCPEKVAKGYIYVDTPFVRVQPSTIAGVAQATPAWPGAKMMPVQQPVTAPKPVVPVSQPTLPQLMKLGDKWRCDKGRVMVRIKGSVIEVVFDVYPATWMGSAFSSFKSDFTLFCSKFMARSVTTWWGTQGPQNLEHVFHAHCGDRGLFVAIVEWLRQQIGIGATPLVAVPGPYGQIVQLVPKGQGVWHALNVAGGKVLDLTKQGARDLVAEYPHIQISGL